MPNIIGGISYPTAGVPSAASGAGGVDGLCCAQCANEAIDMIRGGSATLEFGADEVTQLRFSAIAHLHMLRQPLPSGALRRFLLVGTWSEEAYQQMQLWLSDAAQQNGPHNIAAECVRSALAYLAECPRMAVNTSMRGSYMRACRESLASAERAYASTQARNQPFTCHCCEQVISTPEALLAAVHLHDNGHVDEEATSNVCRPCLEAEFTWCDYEGRWVDEETDTVEVRGISGRVTQQYAESNWYWDEDQDEWTINDPDEEDNRLMDYSANPFDTFKWDSRNRPNALVFGVELEMEPSEPSSTGQRKLISALGGARGKNYILKSDGSLSAGVELVTMPFTLAQHLDGSGVDWKAITDSVKDIGRSGLNTDACGIHIHVNKKALSALTIGKMLVFLNDPGLSSLITTIAQRGSSGYCGRSKKKLTDGTRSSESRYDIMNVSVRHPTCEIRMFKGNLTLERIYKNIEFCHALIQYCRQASMRTLADWGAFAQWLIAHRGQYQHLVRFLIDKKAVGFRQLAKDSRDGQITIEDR